jgi:16S rRNA (cytosine1402-N4)-methyltransferase
MRMDPAAGESAADLLQGADEATLARWFSEYGELPGARRLARAIVAERRERPLRTAADLLRLVRACGAGRGRRHHPGTLVFQALRIAVNDELGALAAWLDALPALLAPGGRAAAISFHSLEDRMVKERFRRLVRACTCPPDLPVCACGARAGFAAVTRKAVRPSETEVAQNPRARSARLRVVEKLR